jgi:hypothetical protein
VLTGCPHDLVKEEGFFDRAAAKDTQESLKPPECTDEVRKKLCPDGKPPSKQCLEICPPR